MNLLKIDRYCPKHHILKKFIKYFWVLKSDHATTIDHKLLPVNNIDFVLNFSSPMKYTSREKVEETPKYSFSGIRSQYYTVHQTGKINMLGVSFFPAGLYPFLKLPLSEFTDKTVALDSVITRFNTKLEEKLLPNGSVSQRIDILEDYFSRLIDPRYIPESTIYRLIYTFHANSDTINIKSFCDRHGINKRKMERIFKKYIGVSPKTFKRINRFQTVLNQILNKDFTDFTSMAYENDYCDQAHFIKDFKSFAGCSPSQFLQEKKSVKEILRY